jgi:hypothetical protein
MSMRRSGFEGKGPNGPVLDSASAMLECATRCTLAIRIHAPRLKSVPEMTFMMLNEIANTSSSRSQ